LTEFGAEIVAQAADPPVVTAHALTRTESRDGPQHQDSESIAEQSAKKVLISAVISPLSATLSRARSRQRMILIVILNDVRIRCARFLRCRPRIAESLIPRAENGMPRF
jgi:hypothetical protein